MQRIRINIYVYYVFKWKYYAQTIALFRIQMSSFLQKKSENHINSFRQLFEFLFSLQTWKA